MSCTNSSAGAITQIFGALPLPALAHAGVAVLSHCLSLGIFSSIVEARAPLRSNTLVFMSHHPFWTEAPRYTAMADALQVIVLAGLGTFHSFCSWVVGRTDNFFHGDSACQAPFYSGRWPLISKNVSQEGTRSSVCTAVHESILTIAHGVMIREDILWLEDLPIIVAGALGLGHALLVLIQVVPRGTVAALQAELLTVLLWVGQGPACLVAWRPTLLVHLAFRTGHWAEVGLSPRHQDALPGTGCCIISNGRAQAILATGAGANIKAAVLHVGSGTDFMVARFKGRRQQN